MERVRFIFLWLAVVFVPIQYLYSNHTPALTLFRSNNFTLFEENGKVGLKDKEGDVLIPALYDAIGWSDGRFSIIDNVVGYKSNGRWGLISTSNKIITPAAFVSLNPGEGSFLVAQETSRLSQRPSFGVINSSGKTIIPFQYDGLQLANMRAVVMSRTGSRFLFGLTDLSHKILIPLKYQQISSLGSLRFAVENFESKTAIFSDDGDQVTEFSIDSISAFWKDHAIVYQNQLQGLINRNGQFVVEPTYGEVLLTDDGTIKVRETDTWFFLDGENNVITQCRADSVTSLSADRYAVTKGGKLQLTDNSFKALHADYYTLISVFHDGLSLYRHGGKTGAMDHLGKVVIPARYQTLVFDGNHFLAITDSGYRNRWTILDRSGKQITEKLYEEIRPFNGSFYPVMNRGYWGAVDARGREIITCVHDSLMQQNGTNVVVKFKGEYGVLNLKENWIVTPQKHPLFLLNEEVYLQYAGSTTFLKSFRGNIIYFSENRLEYDGLNVREHLPSGAYWIIDTNGTVTGKSQQPDETEKIFSESEGLRAIRKDGKFGFIDPDGRLRIANRYEAVKPFQNGRAAIQIRNKWGFIDKREKLVVQPVYDYVGDFRTGFAVVHQNNLFGIIDREGKVVLPLRYEQIDRTANDRFILGQGKSVGLADESGTIVIHPRYDAVEDTGNGYVIAQRNGKFGLLTLRGVSTIPMIYDKLTFDSRRNQYMGLKKSPWKSLGTAPLLQKH